MVRYQKHEAREWARENMRGLSNVVIPSYSRDLRRLNEKGIRHDIGKRDRTDPSYAVLAARIEVEKSK